MATQINQLARCRVRALRTPRQRELGCQMLA